MTTIRPISYVAALWQQHANNLRATAAQLRSLGWEAAAEHFYRDSLRVEQRAHGVSEHALTPNPTVLPPYTVERFGTDMWGVIGSEAAHPENPAYLAWCETEADARWLAYIANERADRLPRAEGRAA